MKGQNSGMKGQCFFLLFMLTLPFLRTLFKSSMPTQKQAVVVKSNKLIEASYRLDLIEQRLILAAIVEARETQKGLGEGFLTIEAKRFAAMFGMEEGSVYGQLKEARKSLFNRFIVVRDVDPVSGFERVNELRWLSTASYIDGAGAIQIRFGQDIVPYISHLESEFTTYRLEKIGRMSSVHAVRLYELLVQYLSIGRREVELFWLKETLGIADEYKAIKDFKKRVLDVAIKQINEHSDIVVSYTQRKTGRAVTHLVFAINCKPANRGEKVTKASKRTVIDKDYVERHANPGESYDQAYRRLLEQAGQSRLVA
jgi:plasmid replication initiation protein